MAGAVHHAHVVTCYDTGQSGGYLYQALELLGGGDLYEFYRSYEVSEKEGIGIALDCARGLEGIHVVGLVYCDINLLNVFVDEEGVVKFGDLGMVCFLYVDGSGVFVFIFG